MSKKNGSVVDDIPGYIPKSAADDLRKGVVPVKRRIPAQADAKTPVRLLPLKIATLKVKITGDAPLCCHAWSQKAIQMILDKQTGKASEGKSPKDVTLDYADSLYWMSRRPDVLTDEAISSGKFGFPAIGLKSAMVTAANDAGLVKTEMRRAFHVVGVECGGEQLVPIIGTPQPDTRMVRIGMGTADVRIRGYFASWSMNVPIRYDETVVTSEQLVNLLNRAGFGVGLGEWRSEKDGAWGLFHVEAS